MIAFSNNHYYTITRRNGMEGWMNTIQALLSVMCVQNEQSPLSVFETQIICNLILDMLPDEDQVVQWETCLKKTA